MYNLYWNTYLRNKIPFKVSYVPLRSPLNTNYLYDMRRGNQSGAYSPYGRYYPAYYPYHHYKIYPRF